MKIKEHFFEKSSGESKILLDLEPNVCIVYITSHGIQIQEPFGAEALTLDQTKPIFTFIQEYLETISQEEKNQSHEKTEQSGTQCASEAVNADGKIPSSSPQENSQSDTKAEERREGENLGEKLEQAS